MIPPVRADVAGVAQLRQVAAALRDRLALPLLLAASCTFRGADRHRLHILAGLAAATGTRLLATGDARYHHPDRRRAALEAGLGFPLDQLRYEYPDEVLERGRSPLETLADRVAAAQAARWPGGTPPAIAAQIAHELR